MANSLDDSEDELRFDSVKKKKDIDSIKLNNDPERVSIAPILALYFNLNYLQCGAPDPIQMLTGNNTTMNIKSRYARRYHSDKDLTYGHKKVFMGSTEEDLKKKKKPRKSLKKKKWLLSFPTYSCTLTRVVV